MGGGGYYCPCPRQMNIWNIIKIYVFLLKKSSQLFDSNFFLDVSEMLTMEEAPRSPYPPALLCKR